MGADGTDTLASIETLSFDGVAYQAVDGSDGDDQFSNTAAAELFVGGDGHDDFVVDALSGSDLVDGGGGGGWIDQIQLNGFDNGRVADDATSYQTEDWTVTLETGSIVSVGGDQLALTENAAGRVEFNGGSDTLNFSNIESVHWTT